MLQIIHLQILEELQNTELTNNYPAIKMEFDYAG
jgi:hypothetical protein